MRRCLAAVVVVVVLLCAAGVQASEQSKRLHARGLVEFHAEHYQVALQLFEQAIAADPDDVYSVYYRAVTKARLNDRAGAIADLQSALKTKPDFDEAALELGVALVESGKFQDSLRWLEQARNTPDLYAQASLFVGVAYLRLGEYAKARSYLTHAATRDEKIMPTARYYSGIADYQQGRLDSAEANFNYVLSTRPDSQIATESKAFLQRVAQARSEVLELYGAVGFQYDSNVILAPTTDAASGTALKEAGVSNQADGRVTINAGAAYMLGRTDWGRLVVGYEFYQSLHFTLHDFNLQDHQANVDFDGEIGPFRYGVFGRYDYYLLKTDDFLREGTLTPRVGLPEGDVGYTEINFRVRRRDFLTSEFQIRDAINYSPSLTQLFFLGSRERYLLLRYQFDQEDTTQGTKGKAFAYDGNQIGWGLAWTFPYDISGQFEYDFRHEAYPQEVFDTVVSGDRKDAEHLIILVARKKLSEHLSLNAGYFAQLNNSNRIAFFPESANPQKLFDYERHIASLSLEVRF
jgi:tetratricopeptide (TPR) repeat protein